jgi:hypothetical protein
VTSLSRVWIACLKRAAQFPLQHKSASPSAIQVKNQRKTISTEEKLHVISRLKKGERIGDICRNVRLAHSSIHTICDNADRIKKVLSQELKCLCKKMTTVLIWMCLSYIFIALEINKYIV